MPFSIFASTTNSPFTLSGMFPPLTRAFITTPFFHQPQSLISYEEKAVDNYKQITVPSDLNKPKFEKKGLILVWAPNKKRQISQYHNELIWITWILAHTLYLAHLFNLFPSGIVYPLIQPPWKYRPPIRKPENRDYIIEPDWNSKFM